MTRPVRPAALGGYEVVAKIAGGGLSTVYLGRSTTNVGDLVALKIVRHDLRADDEVADMFLDEGRLLSRLVHPNIVRVLEVGLEPGCAYIAMELLRGVTLGSLHKACQAKNLGPHPLLAAWIAARVADALHYAHELADDEGKPLAIVHRDVNPDNVFLGFDGTVKLIDFGLAKAHGRRTASEPGIVKGKLPYLSPEQIMQLSLDRRSDVFGLGTTLWEMLTMQRLFRRDTDEATLRAVHRGPIPDPRTVVGHVPEALSPIVLKALERNRSHRYATAELLARDLDALVATDLAPHLIATLNELFPDEQQRQRGWTKPPPTPSVPPISKRVA